MLKEIKKQNNSKILRNEKRKENRKMEKNYISVGKSQTRYNDLPQKYIHAKSLVVTYLSHIFAEKAQPVCQEICPLILVESPKFTEGVLGTL